MGEQPDNLQLDRIDNNKGYCKENCRWATRRQQQRNTRRNHWIEYNGERRVLEEWGEMLGIKANTILTRIRRGWSIEKAMKRVDK